MHLHIHSTNIARVIHKMPIYCSYKNKIQTTVMRETAGVCLLTWIYDRAFTVLPSRADTKLILRTFNLTEINTDVLGRGINRSY